MRKMQTKLATTLRLGLLLALLILVAPKLVSSAQVDTAYVVEHMALSPDGTLLAATGRTTQMRFPIDIIDAYTGQIVTSLNSECPVHSVSWSADSTQIVTTCDSEGPVTIWTVAGGNPMGLTDDGVIDLYSEISSSVIDSETIQASRAQWSPVSDEFAFPDGIAMDLATMDGISHALVDLGGIQRQSRMERPFDWSPDGTRIVSLDDRYLRIWDTVERPLNGHLLNRFEVGFVRALDWHPGGDRIAFSSIFSDTEDLIHILDSETGQDVSVFSIIGRQIDLIAWSPTGDLLAVGMPSRRVGILDASTGAVLKMLSIETFASDLAWSPDGTRLYHNGGPEGVYVNGVPLSSGDIPPLLPPPATAAGSDQAPATTAYPVTHMALSPDGALLATTGRRYETPAGEDRFPIDIIDAFTGQPVTSIDSEFAIRSVSWSADGTQIATSDSWGTVVIWIVADGSAVNLTNGGTRPVNQVQWSPVSDEVAFPNGIAIDLANADGLSHRLVNLEAQSSSWRLDWSPDGTRIASMNNYTLRIWDTLRRPMNGILLNTLDIGYAYAMDWHPYGDGIAISSAPGVIRVVDPVAGIYYSEISIGSGANDVIAWSPNGDLIAVRKNFRTIEIWGALNGELLKTLSAETYLSELVWGPDGNRLYYNDGPEGIYVNGVPLSSEEIPPLLPPRATVVDTAYRVTNMALSPDGTLLATTGRLSHTPGGKELFPIDIIDAFTGQLVTSMNSEFPIRSVSWSADSTQIVTSDNWGPVVIWTVADGSAIGLTGGGAISIDQVQWSPVSGELAFPVGIAIDLASADGISHGLVDREVEASVWQLDWSPDGTRIASIGGGHLRIWDTVERPLNGHLLNRFEVGSAYALDWHPDGDRIAISSDGLVRIFDPETGQVLSSFSVGGSLTDVMAWNPAGDQLAVGMLSPEIGIWDVSTGSLLKMLSFESYAHELAWSPDGTRLYHTGGSEGVYVNGVPLSSEDIPPLFPPPTAAADSD